MAGVVLRRRPLLIIRAGCARRKPLSAGAAYRSGAGIPSESDPWRHPTGDGLHQMMLKVSCGLVSGTDFRRHVVGVVGEGV